MEEQYCSQAEVIEFSSQGKTYTYVGLHLPSSVPLLSPIDGQVAKAKIVQPAPYEGFLVSIINPNNPELGFFGIVGDIKLNNQQYTAKKGDIIAYTQNTGIKVFDNTIALTFTVADSTTNSIKTDEDLLRQNFPNLFKE